jgi:hypothetical protein
MEDRYDIMTMFLEFVQSGLFSFGFWHGIAFRGAELALSWKLLEKHLLCVFFRQHLRMTEHLHFE